MLRLSQIILLVILLSTITVAQSPHGSGLKLDCSVCHNATSWEVELEKSKFDHNKTNFTLLGQHKAVECRNCHVDLVFDRAANECHTCHTDIHQGTVGFDCSKCHTSNSWIIENLNGLHQMNRFPLLGQHLVADCEQCHTRYIDLYFEPLDLECFSCHQVNYISTTFPNHVEAGFSTDCQVCHSITASDWAGASIIHDFFPLVGGHLIQDCFACHDQGGDFTGLSTECYSCHQQDYESTSDPNHVTEGFPTDCSQCHNTSGWGDAEFDHNVTNFPLTGAHTSLNCSGCHANGYSGTPSDCYSCHQQDYESVQDPNHLQNNFPTDCVQCHSTQSWSGADFDHNFYPISSHHNNVSCGECHSEPNYQPQCLGCHQNGFNEGHNLGDPTDCWNCHTTSNWHAEGGD